VTAMVSSISVRCAPWMWLKRLPIYSALRAEAKRLDDAIGDGALIVANPGRALKHCEELVDLRRRLRQTPETPRIYNDAFQVCVAHGGLGEGEGVCAFVQ
jgi:hypothetical protein